MSGTHPNIPTPDRTARNPLPFPGHPPTAAPATDSIRIAARSGTGRPAHAAAGSLAGMLSYFEDDDDPCRLSRRPIRTLHDAADARASVACVDHEGDSDQLMPSEGRSLPAFVSITGGGVTVRPSLGSASRIRDFGHDGGRSAASIIRPSSFDRHDAAGSERRGGPMWNRVSAGQGRCSRCPSPYSNAGRRPETRGPANVPPGRRVLAHELFEAEGDLHSVLHVPETGGQPRASSTNASTGTSSSRTDSCPDRRQPQRRPDHEQFPDRTVHPSNHRPLRASNGLRSTVHSSSSRATDIVDFPDGADPTHESQVESLVAAASPVELHAGWGGPSACDSRTDAA